MGHGEQSTNGAKRWSHGVGDVEELSALLPDLLEALGGELVISGQ